MKKIALIQPLFALLLLFSPPTYANPTPKELFMNAFALDQQSAKILQLMMVVESIAQTLNEGSSTATTSIFQQFNTLLKAHLDDPRNADPIIKDKLGTLSDYLFTLLGDAKDSPTHLIHALEKYSAKLGKEELPQSRQRADDAYLTANKENNVDDQPYFEPAKVFAESITSLDPSRPLVPAYMAEFGLYGVPQDASVALMWYRRAAFTRGSAAQFELTIRLVTETGVPFSQKPGLELIKETFPIDHRLPCLLPHLEDDFGRTAVFRATVGFINFGLSSLVFDLLSAHTHPWVSSLLGLGVSAGTTAYLEKRLKASTPISKDDLNQIIKNNCQSRAVTHSLRLIDIVKDLKLDLDVDRCAQFITHPAVAVYKTEAVSRLMEGPQSEDEARDELTRDEEQSSTASDNDDDDGEDENDQDADIKDENDTEETDQKDEDMQPELGVKTADSTDDLPEIIVEPAASVEPPVLKVIAEDIPQQPLQPNILAVASASIPRPATPEKEVAVGPSSSAGLDASSSTKEVDPVTTDTTSDDTDTADTKSAPDEEDEDEETKREKSMIGSFHLIQKPTDQ